MKTNDHPGVYIPPPIIYTIIFAAAVFLQDKIAIDVSFFNNTWTRLTGILFFIPAIYFIVRSLHQFFRTKNTVLTIKGARSLQISGIYKSSRNPMYVGLVLVYLGFSFFAGNWWNIILLPLLLFIMQGYVIRREEKYLMQKFGSEYSKYKQSVRRWL